MSEAEFVKSDAVEVNDGYLCLLVDEYVFGMEIAVGDAVFRHDFDCVGNLENNVFCMFGVLFEELGHFESREVIEDRECGLWVSGRVYVCEMDLRSGDAEFVERDASSE